MVEQYDRDLVFWTIWIVPIYFLTSLHFITETVKSCQSQCVSITLTSPLFVWLYF